MEGEEVEEEREEVCYCLEGCCKDESFSAAWDQSGLRIVHDSELRVSQTAWSCLVCRKESPSWSILGSQFNQILSLLSQRTLKPGYRIPNQIKLCSSQFSQSITVAVVLCSLSLHRWEGNSSVCWAEFLAISVSDYCMLSQSIIKLPPWKFAEFTTCILDPPILSL